MLALVVQAREAGIAGRLCAGIEMAPLTGLARPLPGLRRRPVRDDPAR